ncbi:MAG TPA: hypothetical protein VMZ69_03610 [Saprospiraceae bacterium]|nr:hypothetical protein [Saprospiraceae bacterium]
MNYLYPKFLLSSFILFISFSVLKAQSSDENISQYNTKQNFLILSGGTGGGDYPFASFGLTLSRQFFNGETLAGIGVHYIGNTADTENWPYVDPVHVFPIMLDIRQKFMESRDGRFATYITADAGYVISITPNGEDDLGEFQYKNGWAINPGIGFRFNVFENVGIMLDATWMHHRHSQEWLNIDKKEMKSWNTGWVRGSVFF